MVTSDLLKNIGESFSLLADWFSWAGASLLSIFASIAPGIAEWLGVEAGSAQLALTFALSLLVWALLFAVVGKIVAQCRNTARVAHAFIRKVSFRISLAGHNMRRQCARIVQKLRFWRRRDAVELETIEFDDLEIAVLCSAASEPPGFAISAPELAERLTLRPSQVQKKLDKLQQYKMIEYVIGSTDGFDNYRITSTGAVFASTAG